MTDFSHISPFPGSLDQKELKECSHPFNYLFVPTRLCPASPKVLGGNLPSFIRFYSSRKDLSKCDQMQLSQVVRLSSGNPPGLLISHHCPLYGLHRSQKQEWTRAPSHKGGVEAVINHNNNKCCKSIDVSGCSEKGGWRLQCFQDSRMWIITQHCKLTHVWALQHL